ncbi:AAA family ATPase [Cognatiluteimonas weifangensis]|uniref:AAA+ ATPase domain-containing protein n=1 Tax=Cognatiluteimonas weifangensis TaxID=2303539 RepID=A0A372DNY7_9GAMM|nr:AAA family ATPase [Luteimonas weifangensis]RFP61107.1 hypothetical protein D0Y53_05075 [Luteimonas weifangensis]
MQSIEHASAFLALLDPVPNAAFHFRTLANGDHKGRNYSGTLAECWPDLVRDNAAGRNVFAVVNAGGHKKADITRVRALFVDQDKPDGRNWRSLYGIGRDPHMVVQSSPGKWHAYWCVHDFPLERFKPTQQALAAEFGTDPAISDLPRVMRLPGFLHLKGEPFLSHLVARNVELPRYGAELAASLPVAATVSAETVDPLAALDDFHKILRRVEHAVPGERNTIVNNAAYQLGRYVPAIFDLGTCTAKLLAAVASWPDADDFTHTINAGLQAGMAAPKIPLTLPTLPTEGKTAKTAKTATPPVWRSSGGLPPLIPLAASTVNLLRADNVKPEPINWLWPGYLAEGKFHILAGDPGCGKTTAACSLGAIITRGGQWPDKGQSPVGDVLIWSGEDDIANTLVPRIMACGGDRSRVHFIDGTTIGGERQPFDPALHIGLLESALDQLPAIKLLIVDPVVSVVAGDSHKNAEVRRALQPLVDLAGRRGIAVLGITHFSKGTSGRSPSERVTGSLAFVALARVVMVAARKETEDGQSVHLLVRSKSNIGPSNGGFTYQLSFPELGPGIVGSCVHWGEAVDGSAREILDMAEEDNSGTRKDAKDWLAEQLADGPVSSKQLMADAKEAGHSWRTLERAKKDIGARARKTEAGIWEWSVPTSVAGLSPPALPLLTPA